MSLFLICAIALPSESPRLKTLPIERQWSSQEIIGARTRESAAASDSRGWSLQRRWLGRYRQIAVRHPEGRGVYRLDNVQIKEKVGDHERALQLGRPFPSARSEKNVKQ
jgi:hypothetical protein